MSISLLGVGIYFLYQIHTNVQQVKAYTSEVKKEAEANQVSQYEQLIFAIIYTESKGQSNDLMQSSESVYGQREMIETPEESIEFGVQYFAQAVSKAQAAGCDIWTAVQAYNFGLDYIDFVASRGQKNSVELAEEYSKEVLSPILGNSEKKTYPYYRPQAVFYNGGYLYKNGGNMFYADIVKMNAQFIKWL